MMNHEQRETTKPDDRKVTKVELFEFLERQFVFADRNKDGALDIDELRSFLNRISHPDTYRHFTANP
jgi:hypothetical protein